MSRRVLLALGLLTLAAACLTDLPRVAERAFWSHMTMRMTVVAVAAPLITLGVAETRFDPALRAPVLFAPIPASIAELIVVWMWHAPALHHAARHSAVGLIVDVSSTII